ncbi:MAG: DUF4367 domain-containing protein [Lachnospiraceae bacterium]
MNKKEIISKVLSEDNSSGFKESDKLEAMIDNELSKPDPDCELVYELTLNALESKGRKPLCNDANAKLEELKAIQNREKKHFHMPKLLTGLAAACIMLVFTNVISVSAWNMNIFSLFVEFTQGGAKINFGQDKEEIVLPTSESDPYGIIGKCEEIGITVETPHYIPNGFILTEIGTDDDNPQRKYICFVYEKGKQLISITIDDFMGDTVGIPSDHHNLSEREICGHTAIISKEDNQMISIFNSGNFYVSIGTRNVDYIECDKILDSIQ